MKIWIDAQMSPSIAAWISSNFSVSAVAIRDIGLRDSEDKEIFEVAKRESVVVMTKDSDFVLLLEKYGAPPQIIWVTCGNTSNYRLREILSNTLPRALELLGSGERLVEISNTP
jgi:predicted nuclease of predicted toxin-antitoxin system